ncbi:Serine/threonine-protein kinase prp4 [Smittium culicis]|uniref:Serine/threonine-protein kinase prp4 n=1 Tax=Smittium culicis TaxID=133412 RepID=A0A1R1XL26_9FUNG|nr:Serine/threonine-protein kinase prp4 [Smittium culicis]
MAVEHRIQNTIHTDLEDGEISVSSLSDSSNKSINYSKKIYHEYTSSDKPEFSALKIENIEHGVKSQHNSNSDLIDHDNNSEYNKSNFLDAIDSIIKFEHPNNQVLPTKLQRSCETQNYFSKEIQTLDSDVYNTVSNPTSSIDVFSDDKNKKCCQNYSLENNHFCKNNGFLKASSSDSNEYLSTNKQKIFSPDEVTGNTSYLNCYSSDTNCIKSLSKGSYPLTPKDVISRSKNNLGTSEFKILDSYESKENIRSRNKLRDSSSVKDKDYRSCRLRDSNRDKCRDSSRHRVRDSSGVKDRESRNHKDRVSNRYTSRDASRRRDRDSSRYASRDAIRRRDRDSSRYMSRSSSRNKHRNSSREKYKDAKKICERNSIKVLDENIGCKNDINSYKYNNIDIKRPLHRDSARYKDRDFLDRGDKDIRKYNELGSCIHKKIELNKSRKSNIDKSDSNPTSKSSKNFSDAPDISYHKKIDFSSGNGDENSSYFKNQEKIKLSSLSVDRSIMKISNNIKDSNNFASHNINMDDNLYLHNNSKISSKRRISQTETQASYDGLLDFSENLADKEEQEIMERPSNPSQPSAIIKSQLSSVDGKNSNIYNDTKTVSNSAGPKTSTEQKNIRLSDATKTTSQHTITLNRSSKENQNSEFVVDLFDENSAISENIDTEADLGNIIKGNVNNGEDLTGNWDDDDGYYKLILGEVLDDRYEINSVLGQGVFSSVVGAIDKSNNNDSVAIKIIRNNETMHNAGLSEMKVLEDIESKNPKNSKYIIRFIRKFEHRHHLCLVFESMSMNLRQTVKLFGSSMGLNIDAVKLYGHQLFCGLLVLSKNGILHADLKPDNVLISKSKKYVKIADFGSAIYLNSIDESAYSGYLVSRYYRAPEIILGNPNLSMVDVWSLGSTLYELFTGKVLFPGRTNNQMLKLIMQMKGMIPNKVLKRSKFALNHFGSGTMGANSIEMSGIWDKSVLGKSNIFFMSSEIDLVSNSKVVKKIEFQVNSGQTSVNKLKQQLLEYSGNSAEVRMKINLFADLIDKCIEISPEKRISPAEALKHPFFH